MGPKSAHEGVAHQARGPQAPLVRIGLEEGEAQGGSAEPPLPSLPLVPHGGAKGVGTPLPPLYSKAY